MIKRLHYESRFFKRFIDIKIFNLVYESKVEYANIWRYVILTDW